MFSLLKEKNLPPVPVKYCIQSLQDSIYLDMNKAFIKTYVMNTYAGAFIGFSHSIVDTLIFHFLEKDVVPDIEMEIVAAVVSLPVSTYTEMENIMVK